MGFLCVFLFAPLTLSPLNTIESSTENYDICARTFPSCSYKERRKKVCGKTREAFFLCVTCANRRTEAYGNECLVCEKHGWKAPKKTMSYRVYVRYTYNLFDDFIKGEGKERKAQKEKCSRSTTRSVKTEKSFSFG